MTRRYSSFIGKRGSIEVLLELSKEPRSFNELKKLRLSPNTVLARLREAQKLGLAEVVPVSSEKRTLVKYDLSKEGQALVSKFDIAVTQYTKLQGQLKELSQKKQEMFNRIAAELARSPS